MPGWPSKGADDINDNGDIVGLGPPAGVPRSTGIAMRPRPSPTRIQPRAVLPGQVVLVMQGGGALGAYHVGVYQALHEAGIEPDWVIGTSIGGINAALIAGNAPENRLARLKEFWKRMEYRALREAPQLFPALTAWYANLT